MNNQPDDQATTWQDVAEYFLGDYVREHTPDECREEAFRRSVEPDNQAGDELDALLDKHVIGTRTGAGLENPSDTETTSWHYDKKTLKAGIETYAERLATRRVIQARIDEAGSIVNISGEGYFHIKKLGNGDTEYIRVDSYIEELENALSATLTKEARS